MRRTKKEAEQTRRDLIDKAAFVFKKVGYQNANLWEIAKYAGVTRGAIAWHFKDKASLYREVMAAQMEDSASVMIATMSQPLSAEEKMEKLIDYLSTNPLKMHVHIVLLDNLLKEQPPEFGDLTAAIQNHYRFLLENIEVVVQRHVDANPLNEPVNTTLVARLIFSLFKGFYIDFEDQFSTYTPAEVKWILGNIFQSIMKSLSTIPDQT